MGMETPRTCPKCGKASDPRSKKGYCHYCLPGALAAWKAMMAAKCEDRDARHAEYRALLDQLTQWARRAGVDRVAIAPRNSGLYHYAKRYGNMDADGFLVIGTKAAELAFYESVGI